MLYSWVSSTEDEHWGSRWLLWTFKDTDFSSYLAPCCSATDGSCGQWEWSSLYCVEAGWSSGQEGMVQILLQMWDSWNGLRKREKWLWNIWQKETLKPENALRFTSYFMKIFSTQSLPAVGEVYTFWEPSYCSHFLGKVLVANLHCLHMKSQWELNSLWAAVPQRQVRRLCCTVSLYTSVTGTGF